MTSLRTLAAWAMGIGLLAAVAQAQADQETTMMTTGQTTMIFYVGTYTGPKSKGIYLYQLDAQSGKLTSLGVAGETNNPSFLALHPSLRFLYAVNEGGDFQGRKTGSVTAFAVDQASGKLSLLNQQPSEGLWPCYVTIDSAGKHALVANYGSGTAAVLPIADDGKLAPPSAVVQHQGRGPNAKRQEGPHAHCVKPDPSGRFAMVVDLGIDKVMVYRFDAAKGSLEPNDPPAAEVAPGAGPRHVAFHPNGSIAYVINELDNTMTVFAYDAHRGVFSELQTVPTLPAGFTGGNKPAEVQVHPSGKFVYGSNRGHDSIAIFSVDAQTGKLTPAGHVSTEGREPRNFAIDPSGAYLVAANQNSDSLVAFRINPGTGALEMCDKIEAPTPVCVRFVPR